MSKISDVVKSQVEKGLSLSKDESKKLIDVLENKDMNVYCIHLNTYLFATSELLFLKDSISRQLRKIDNTKDMAIFVKGFDVSPWYGDIAYQTAPSALYSFFENSKPLILSSTVLAGVSGILSAALSVYTGPVYMRIFKSGTDVEVIPQEINDDLFSMRAGGKAQRVITSTLPSAFSLVYSLYKKQGILNSVLNGLIGNVMLTNKMIETPLISPDAFKPPPNNVMSTKKVFPKEPSFDEGTSSKHTPPKEPSF